MNSQIILSAQDIQGALETTWNKIETKEINRSSATLRYGHNKRLLK
jgi:hypothetical protein